MHFFSKPVIAVLTTGVTMLIASGSSATPGGETIYVQHSATRDTTYLSRVRLEGETRQGVIEAATGIRGKRKKHLDLTVSLHGITPDVTVRVVGSLARCGVNDDFTFAVFDVTLPASSNDDRFLAESLRINTSIRGVKSVRILENDVQTGCRKPTLYSLKLAP